MKKKIILYIAMSLDGFIADKKGKVDFLDPYNESKQDFGYKEFFPIIKTIIMGNTTYKQYGADAFKEKEVFVFSRKKKGKEKNITFVNEAVKEFTNKLDGNIWMLGGATILDEYLKHDLIDEFIITIMPVLLGNGIPLFKGEKKKLKLLDVKSFDMGVVQLHYKK